MGKRKIRTTRDYRRAQAKAAMPDVKRLVAKYGRPAIHNCLAKIAKAESGQRKLALLKTEVASLERSLRA